ncbi:MAG: hypothetical protein ACRENY_05225 [Candidatus Dormibacteria bacterium]
MSPQRWLPRALLALYPADFQRRYGEELLALVDELGVGPRLTLDLLSGAVSAWVGPRWGQPLRSVLRLRRRRATFSLLGGRSIWH